MHLVGRSFRQIDPPPLGDEVPQPLSSFFAQPALVVLGDPGAGKTTAFIKAALEEANAVYVRLRDFLTLSAERWRDHTVYIDGLDEERAKTRDGRTTLDALRERLDALGRPSLRLSCRAADWYGSSDRDNLQMVAPRGSVTVLQLLPLAEADIRSIVEAEALNSDAFLDDAQRAGVQDLLANPQTLFMLLAVVKDGSWPRTRSELFSRAIDILSRETNEEHLRTERGALSSLLIREAAATINAITLCAGISGIALSRSAAAPDFPFVGDFPGNAGALHAAPRTRLFASLGPERVAPLHRSLAEYLAAAHLAQRIQAGWPLARALSLLTGYDGGVLSDLRGVYAWLAVLSPSHSEYLVRNDSLGIILYGDASVLPTSPRRVLLQALADLARTNPWFRSESWAAQPFGGLASPDMEPLFRHVLQDASNHPVLLSCILDAIRFGHPLRGLSTDVLSLVRQNHPYSFVRLAALQAYCHLESFPTQQLRLLLDDIHHGHVPDEDCQLRGELLETLYPAHLSAAAVVDYLVEPPPSLVGTYVMFVAHELPSRTSDENLPSLLDALVARSHLHTTRRRDSLRRLLNHVLVRGLQIHGPQIATPRLFLWLGLALDEHRSLAIDEEAAAEIRRWLGDRPAVIHSLFQHWLAHADVTQLPLESLDLWQRLQRVDTPPRFGQWLLALAREEPSVQRANFLFREAVLLRTSRAREDAPSVDELYSFVDANPTFLPALLSEMSWEIPEWRRKQAEYQQQHARQKKQALGERVATLLREIDGIRSGSAVAPLRFLARVWFGLFADLDQEATPYERLRNETNDEIIAAALTGFVAALHHPEIPTAKAIGNTHAQGQEYILGYTVLAGMDILAEQSLDTLLALPRATLEAAIAFHLVNLTNKPHPWVKDLAGRLPGIAGAALSEFWRAHFARRATDIPGLHLAERAGPVSAACREATLQLLEDFPSCAEGALRTLLRAVLAHSESSTTRGVIRKVTRSPRVVRGAQRLLWLMAGFVVSPQEFGPRLRNSIRASKEKVRLAMSLAGGLWPAESGLYTTLDPRPLASLIQMAGRHFPPPALPDGWRARNDDVAMGELIRAMLRTLGQNASRDATAALVSLSEDLNLSAWQELVAHELSVHTRNRRDKEFRYPSTTEVIEALEGGRPANIRDLRALVGDHLRETGQDLRHGSTDGYKALWNVDSRQRPLSPRPEEDCRDRLLERIRPRLAAVGCLAEPEGHFADDKRADIKVLLGSLIMPVEIKRHSNSELWSAPRDQLQKRYSRDPGCGGHGIYLVLWFGVDHAALPPPPDGMVLPTSPAELEQALLQMLPLEGRALTDVIVLDVARSA